MKYLVLREDEAGEISQLLDRALRGHSKVDMASFLAESCVLSSELPVRIRRAFYEFKLFEEPWAICVRNNPISRELGATPTALRSKEAHLQATREEAIHILYSCLLGEVFAWSSQLEGRILNDIVPLREYEEQKISFGSKFLFDLHTEDAFHPLMPDYLGLMCLRNPDCVPTVVACVEDVELDERVRQILREPRFIVKPNIIQNVQAAAREEHAVAVLFGPLNRPYMRVNTVAMQAVAGDSVADMALEALTIALRRVMRDLILEPGDVLFLDNFRVAHGRRSYRPRYDGADRWLKRVYITRDLRKSASWRMSADSRVVSP